MANEDENELPDYSEDSIGSFQQDKAGIIGQAANQQPLSDEVGLPQGERSSQRELPERKMINESYSKDPYPLWMWLFILVFVVALLWGLSGWFQGEKTAIVKGNPFLQVNNRELSLFLWQFPEYMRINSPVKEGYLPGFEYQEGKVSLKPSEAENIVAAPPELLFLYHTWSRLLKDSLPLPPVSYNDLRSFLEQEQAWTPDNWPEAPASYSRLYQELQGTDKQTGAKLTATLPRPLHIAIIGWKSYMMEGKAIDQLSPTYAQLAAFLKEHPTYGRSYWRNILLEKRPNYLRTLTKGGYRRDDTVPSDEMTGFLKMALYNSTKP